VYYDSACNISVTQEYADEFQKALHSKCFEFEYEYCMSRIDVALVDKCIRDLKTGKAMALVTLVLSTCSLLIL